MVHLPSLLPVNNKSLSSSDSGTISLQSRKSTTSFNVCGDCSLELNLPLPVENINPELLRIYKAKCAHIQDLRQWCLGSRLSYPTQLFLEDKEGSIENTDSSSKRGPLFSESDFPLLKLTQELCKQKSVERNTLAFIKDVDESPLICQDLVWSKPLKNIRYKRQRPRRLPVLRAQTDLLKCESKAPLIAEPGTVSFNHFEIDQCYKKKLKIVNVSNGNCKFTLHKLSAQSQFQVERRVGAEGSLAAAMSIQLMVIFHCRSLADVSEELEITTQSGDSQHLSLGKLVVKIEAVSPPPHLIDVDCSPCNIFNMADVNSLIDCGSNLVGDESISTVTLKNIGPKARFFFVSEEDWHSLEFSLDSSNSLKSGSFKIEPIYFSLGKDEQIDITIVFNPASYGLQTTQLYLLCDNTALKKIDFVGDGYLYDPSFITFVGMMKLFDVNIDDDDTAKYYLDFGSVLKYRQTNIFFGLFNDSDVSLTYRWLFRKAHVPGMDSESYWPYVALEITPGSGRITANTAVVFCLSCDSQKLETKSYRCLLTLVIDDLPNKCIPIDLREKILPGSIEDQMRSIEVNSIEVWVECITPTISLFPYEIDFFGEPLVCGKKVSREVTVITGAGGPIRLNVVDKSSEAVNLIADPSIIDCPQFTEFKCNVTVEPLKPGQFDEVLVFISKEFDVALILKIKGTCIKPHLTNLTEFLDFGCVKKDSYQVAHIKAKNPSTSSGSEWAIKEFIFNPIENGRLELPSIGGKTGELSAESGEFCHENSEVYVKYSVNTEEDQMFCSVLDWNGHMIPVLADVQESDVSLSTYRVITESLLQGVTHSFTLHIQNQSVLDTQFVWGNPLGPPGQVLVEVVPRCGVIQPAEHLLVSLHMTPLSTGVLQNMMMPCFIEGQFQPLLLKIEGTVEGLQVRVKWDEYCISWPSSEYTGSKKLSLSLHSILCPCPPNSLTQISQKAISFLSLTVNEISNDNSEPSETKEACVNDIAEQQFDNVEYAIDEIGEACEEADEEDNVSVASSIPYLNWPIIGGRYTTTEPMSEEMERHLRDLFTLEELRYSSELNSVEDSSHVEQYNTLYFQDIPIGEAITQAVYIRNDTKMISFYEACVVTNFERKQEPSNPCDFGTCKFKQPFPEFDDKWRNRVCQDRGLTIFVDPAKGELPADDYVTIYVTVTAVSWGDYTDALILQLGDLDQLVIRIRVTITHPPVTTQPVLRFGAISFKSSIQQHWVSIQNSSHLPLHVCWQMFSPTEEEWPYGVILVDNNPFELQLAPFYGSFNSPHFQVVKRYTLLEPFSTTRVEVLLDPKTAGVEIPQEVIKNLHATLIGHVFLTDEAKYISSCEGCVRIDGMTLGPLKVQVEAQVELPLVTLLNIHKKKLLFKCSANQVMSTKRRVWSEKRIIKVQNKSSTYLEAKVSTVGYFHVAQIDYPCVEKPPGKNKHCIYLYPGEICEITLVCKVTESTLNECFEDNTVEYVPDEPDYSKTIQYGMLCFQQENFKQDVKLQLWLYWPMLQCSPTALSFGLVHVDDTKWLLLTIVAQGQESFRVYFRHGKTPPVFSVNVDHGILQPKTVFYLQVFFSPKSCIMYKDELVVQSCLDTLTYEIPISGIGTFNYRAHQY